MKSRIYNKCTNFANCKSQTTGQKMSPVSMKSPNTTYVQSNFPKCVKESTCLSWIVGCDGFPVVNEHYFQI